MTGTTLSGEQRSAFEADGALCLRGVIERAWLLRLWDAADEAMTRPPRDPEQRYFRRIGLWREIRGFGDFCRGSILPSLAAALLRTPKVNLLYDQLFVKEPDMVDRSSWHNDQPYWPVRGTQVVTIWLAFDHITKENGALEFIRGSHRWKERFQPYQSAEGGRVLEPYHSGRDDGFVPIPDIDATRDDYEILSFDLAPGDALAFHALTVHASCPNTTSDRQRRAYSMRFTGEQVRYYDGPVWNVYIVNPALRTGDPLDSEQYPVVYDERGAASAAQ